MNDGNPYPSPSAIQAEEDRARFAERHVFNCPECTTTGWCDVYRAMLTDLFGAEMAAWLLDGEESEK